MKDIKQTQNIQPKSLNPSPTTARQENHITAASIALTSRGLCPPHVSVLARKGFHNVMETVDRENGPVVGNWMSAGWTAIYIRVPIRYGPLPFDLSFCFPSDT